jgi:hypothetical protein
MGINIRQKGQGGEREVADAMNSIVNDVYQKYGRPLPEKPVVQRNQNQSAVGGSDLKNPFRVAIEIKRQETLSINTWWTQCCKSAKECNETPVLIFRQNGKKWRVIMNAEIPIVKHMAGLQARVEIDWNTFLQWFYWIVDRAVHAEEFP